MQTLKKRRGEQQRAIAVDCGIAEISRDGISTMLSLNPFQVPGHFVERFGPADSLPTIVSAAYGKPEAVLIKVNILQSDGFGTDVTAAERIVLVPADIETPVRPDGNFNAAHSFAQVAGAIVRRIIFGAGHCD